MRQPHPDAPTPQQPCGCDPAAAAECGEPVGAAPEVAGLAVYRIPTMDCAAEEGEIRHALATLTGIRSLRFQLGERTLAIDAPADVLSQALQVLRTAGFSPVPVSQRPGRGGAQDHADHDHHHAPGHGRWAWGAGLPRYAMALLLALGAESVALWGPPTTLLTGLGMAMSAVAIGLAGLSTYIKGLAALRNGRLNINALMTVAVTGAFLIGQWPEAAMVMALYAIAEFIEGRAVDRARNAIQGLLDMSPQQAEVRQADGSWVERPVEAVEMAAVVRVRPGARIPLDGVVTAGVTAVDQSPVTGESLPVDKVVGDLVFAGTLNTTGMVEVQVRATASGTLLARIIQAVEQAQGARAPTQQFVDRFAAIYTPSVFVLALVVCLLTPWLLDWTWAHALYKALVLLVIACPCALVISTPVTVVSGLAAAARRGILIKGGVHLEGARNIRAIALDKTGTITQGKPVLVATDMLPSALDAPQVLHWAADLAGRSDHPVSRAIAQGLARPVQGQAQGPLEGVKAVLGRGIEAVVQGRTLLLGNHRLLEERGLCSAALEARMAVHEAQGRTVTLLAWGGEVLAIFAVADTIRDSSRQAIAELHALGVSSVMLTGDNLAVAKAIALQAGIDDARGNLLPEDKLSAIQAMQARYGHVAMVGDGINDAPALARSSVGFAMGGAGSDTAMEAADVVIMNDDLRRIAEVIRLSRTTHSILRQNIALALGIKGIFLWLALFHGATMWMAVFADMGASLLVVFNGLRVLGAAPAGGRQSGQPGR